MKRLNLFVGFSKTGLVLFLAIAMLFSYPLDAQRQKESTTKKTGVKQEMYYFQCKKCNASFHTPNKKTIDDHKAKCQGQKHKKASESKKKNTTKKKKK